MRASGFGFLLVPMSSFRDRKAKVALQSDEHGHGTEEVLA